MLPGPKMHIECPICGNHATAFPSVLSGNLLGEIYYTDQKLVAPMLPTPQKIVKCAGTRSLVDVLVTSEQQVGNSKLSSFQA